MALHDDVVRDASDTGGLFRFEEVEVVEGAAWRIELPHNTANLGYTLDDGSLFDFGVLTAVSCAVIADDESVVQTLTFEPHVGWFALTATSAATAGKAGLLASTSKGLRCRFYCYGALTDGRVVQIVDAESVVIVRHRGKV